MRNERGFAIPMVVLLVAIITVILSSGFVRVRADREVAESQEVSAEAVAVARSGLHMFLESRSTRPPNNFVDTMYVTGGYAIINASIVQNPADTLASQTWAIRSTGYVIDAGTGATPRAQRTVAQFVEWQTGTINVRGGLVTPNGVQYHNRGTITIRGYDQCGSQPAVAGLRTAGVTGGAPTLDYGGSPNLMDHGSSAGVATATATNIDWLDILAGGIIPDYTAVQNSDFSYPITMITGNYSPSSYVYGSGLLIVTGDFTPQSWVYWLGVILVGGKIEFNSYFNYVWGATVTGLNELQSSGNPQRTVLGWTGSSSSWYSANLYYASCYVDAALAGLTGFAPIENGWVDNWSSY